MLGVINDVKSDSYIKLGAMQAIRKIKHLQQQNKARPVKPLEQEKQKNMIQYNNLNSKMESRNHSKNAVSLKNLMSMINLKPIFILFFCLFCIVNVSFAEKNVGSYSLSYFNRQYDIEASEIKYGKFSVYIQVSAERKSTRAMINVESTDLEEFKQFLLNMKAKYVEWVGVAKANNVTDMSKDMDFKSPSTTICWSSSKWWFSFGHKLQPRFIILDDGRNVVTIVKKVESSSNQYIDETIYWVFSDTKEIDELVAQLDVEKITAKLQETDLFK